MSVAAPSPSEALATDASVAVQFLQWLDPDGRHQLVAIHPITGRVVAKTFESGTWSAMAEWIDAHQADHNLYFAANEPRARLGNRRASKDDIMRIRLAWADVDPEPPHDPEPGWLQRERRRISGMLAQKIKGRSPAAVIDSGGGFQVIWKLKEPLPAKEWTEEAEAQNRGISEALDGDNATFNIDRLLRLPGTINRPNAKKRAQGRVDASARWSGPMGGPATLEKLAEWAPPKPRRSKSPAATDGTIGAIEKQIDMAAVEAVADYDDLLRELRMRFERARQTHCALDRLWSGEKDALQGDDESRSGFAFSLAVMLRPLGRGEGEFSATEFGQLCRVWEHGYGSEPEKFDRRQIARAWTKAPAAPPLAEEDFEPVDPKPIGAAATWDEPTDLWADDAPPPDLPEGVVPPVIDRFARDRGARLGVEAGAVAVAATVAIGSLTPASTCLQIRQRDPHWTVHPILWGMLLGEPGSNKSPTLKQAMAAVEAVERDWREAYARAISAHDDLHALLHDGKRKRAAPGADESARPKCRRKVIRDATTEAVAEVLADNPHGLLYFSDELAGFIGGMDAYRTKGGKDRPFWLEAKDGGSYTVDRKGSGVVVVPHRAVAVLGGIQPDRLRALAPTLSPDGLLQRFMPVSVRRTGRGLDASPNEPLDAAVTKVAMELSTAPDDRRYLFAPEADEERRALEDFKESELLRPDNPPALKQWLEKLPNEFGRLALVFHHVEHCSGFASDLFGMPPERVSHGTAARARRFLTELVYPHARAMYVTTWGAAEGEDHAKWIADYILSRRLREITAREIYRSCSALKQRDRRKGIVPAMFVLEMHEWVKPTGAPSRDGSPRQWTVNEAVHDGRFAERAEKERRRRLGVREKIAIDGAMKRAQGA